MNRLNFTLLSAGLLVLSAATSFAAVSVVSNSDAQAGASNVEEKDFWSVSSVEDAEDIAGFRPNTQDYLPRGLVSNSINVKTIGIATPTRFTVHHWNYPGATEFGMFLIQSPMTFSLGKGEPTIINGVPGERRVTAATPPDRPYQLLSLNWSDGGFSYALTARLSESIDEEVMRKIAASIR